ncbi:MAG TPA: hypothetical protein PKD78_08890, partial [Saprospiraceae bacterium]|nr:hypothetical protein [Saprospiraceae bacterium]
MKSMTKTICSFFCLLLAFSATAQADCEVGDCPCILKKANDAFSSRKYEDAVPLFQAYKVCQADHAAYADSMVLRVFRAMEKEKRRAYANDLAYKSRIALQGGDHTTAFRLAEFAHRYVDDDNPKVTDALVQALYY